MKNSLIKWILLFSLVFCVSPSSADDDPKNFKEVMQRISVNMADLVDPILKGEFSKVHKIAERVANHDEPPLMLRVKIIAELGMDFIDFKKYDDEVHMNAVSIQLAAKNKDIDGMITGYGKTMQSCHDCHKKYRKRIRKLNF